MAASQAMCFRHPPKGTAELVIGTKGNSVSKDSPLIQGGTYGINSTSFKFYDGIIKGKTDSYVGKVIDTEANYGPTYETENEYKVSYLVPANYGDGTYYYENLNKAFTNAESGKTITTLKDVAESIAATVSAGKTYTLDLNGNAITINKENIQEEFLFIINNGNLTVKDSKKTTGQIKMNISNGKTISMTAVILQNNQTGTLNIEGGAYILESGGTVQLYSSTLKNSLGTANVKSGSIVSKRKETYKGWSCGIFADGGTVKVLGDAIVSGDTDGIINQAGRNATISIEGGKIFGGNYGIELTQHGEGKGNQTQLTVSGNAVINGKICGIINTYSVAEMKITGGEITGGTYGIYNTTTGALTLTVLANAVTDNFNYRDIWKWRKQNKSSNTRKYIWNKFYKWIYIL